jgi:hypothetical protein
MFAEAGENYPSLAMSFHDVSHLVRRFNRDYPRLVLLEESIHMSCWAYSWLGHHFLASNTREIMYIQRALKESHAKGIELSSPLRRYLGDPLIPDEIQTILKMIQWHQETNAKLLKRFHIPLHAVVLFYLDRFVTEPESAPFVRSRIESEVGDELIENVGGYFRSFSPGIKRVYAHYKTQALSRPQNRGLLDRYIKLTKIYERTTAENFTKLTKFILNPSFPKTPLPRKPESILIDPSEDMDTRLETVYQIVAKNASMTDLSSVDAKLQERLGDTIDDALIRPETLYVNSLLEQNKALLNSHLLVPPSPLFHPYAFYSARQKEVADEAGVSPDDIFVVSAPLVEVDKDTKRRYQMWIDPFFMKSQTPGTVGRWLFYIATSDREHGLWRNSKQARRCIWHRKHLLKGKCDPRESGLHLIPEL